MWATGLETAVGAKSEGFPTPDEISNCFTWVANCGPGPINKPSVQGIITFTAEPCTTFFKQSSGLGGGWQKVTLIVLE